MTDQKRTWKRHIVKTLTILLILMVCLAILQWFIIKELFGFGVDMVEDALIQQAPEGVDRYNIEATFDRVKTAGMQLPFSFLTGKISLRKIRAVGRYAKEANNDGSWDADEINTLLRMMDASVGVKGGIE
ncbi:MAG: hypothetical protein OXU27_00285 [Candidatus Poribacteria bacterium]|nr:hypothetical protein [Candidatus Poribacteria bacterium]MDE0327015.1 hypothetical protein [Candidatus Poribacteria bacterium]